MLYSGLRLARCASATHKLPIASKLRLPELGAPKEPLSLAWVRPEEERISDLVSISGMRNTNESNRSIALLVHRMHVKKTKSGLTVPLAAPILQHLESLYGLKVIIISHIESGFPLILGVRVRFQRMLFVLHLLLLPAAVIGKTIHSGFSVEPKVLERMRRIWFETRTAFWSKWFARLEPILVFGVGLTESEILAARGSAISTIEIQHGIFNSTAPDYYWPSTKPDFLATWPFATRSDLCGSGIAPLRAPFPFPSEDTPSVNLSSKSHNMLCALSWGEADGDSRFFGAMPRGLSLLMDQVKPHHSSIVFRTHPALKRRYVRRLRKRLARAYPGSKFLDGRREALESTLSKCRAVILDTSSTWASAVALGIPILTTSQTTFMRLEEIFPDPVLAGCFFVTNEFDYQKSLARIAELESSADSSAISTSPHDWSDFTELLRTVNGTGELPKSFV